MGDANQLTYVRRHAAEFAAPFLEVGSKDYGNTQDLRSLFADKDRYLGVDQAAGPKVDLVLDLTDDFDAIDRALGGMRFGTIFCLSVLEHCRQPFRMADALTRLLRPGGKLCVSVPFAFQFHGFPSDYWRFTPEGIKVLFPALDFDLQQGVVATSLRNDLQPLDERLGRIELGSKAHLRAGRPLRALVAKTFQLLGRAGLLRWIFGHRCLFPPTCISMIGTRRAEGTPSAQRL
jgi:SAM-dependent methyltransferase